MTFSIGWKAGEIRTVPIRSKRLLLPQYHFFFSGAAIHAQILSPKG
jgi:hypothetical protein